MASFTPLTCKPKKGDKYIYLYNNSKNCGKSNCISGKPVDCDCNVLCNCVGWACGRFNHIYNLLTGYDGIKYPNFCCNAEKFIEVAKSYGLTVGTTPKPGAIMCWQKGATLNGSDGAGHVAVVERVDSSTQVLTSESGYGNFVFANKTRSNSNGNWGAGSAYTFRGFIYNPAVSDEAPETTTSTATESSVQSSASVTTNTQKDIWDALKKKGFNEVAISGIMGCWEEESANKACRVEGDYLKSFPGFSKCLSSRKNLNCYTEDILFPAYKKSNISINKNAYKGSDNLYYPGIGLAQWTGPRAYNLFAFAESKGKSVMDYNVQIDFFWNHPKEFCSKGGLFEKLNLAPSPEDAATIFLDGFEMYNDWHITTAGKKQDKIRREHARKIYNKYHKSNTTTTTQPKKDPVVACSTKRDTTKNQIQVLASDLRVRSCAGMSGTVIGTATKNGYYTYYEMKNADNYTWYRIGTNQWVAYSKNWAKVFTKISDNKLCVGDVVTITPNAPIFGKDKKFPNWIYMTRLFVRSIHNEKITVSTFKIGPTNGSVDKKYVKKV